MTNARSLRLKARSRSMERRARLVSPCIKSTLRPRRSMRKAFRPFPAATIRQVAKEYGEAAHIGETITIDGVTLPYRPVCVDAFSGITRHKHSFLTCWSVFSLNNLVGATNAVGGFIGFDPACNGWADNNPQMAFRPGIWEEDGFIEDVSLMLAFPHSYYRKIRESDYTPKTMGMLFELQPMSEDNHFEHVAQAHPTFTTPRRLVAFCYACKPD